MNINQNNEIYNRTDVEIHNQKRPSKSLFGLILNDLLGHQKISLLLLLLIIISAGAVLITTQQVRKQLFEREQLLLEQDVLESEWRNLVIEEKAKNQLSMSYVTPQNESVIVIKSK